MDFDIESFLLNRLVARQAGAPEESADRIAVLGSMLEGPMSLVLVHALAQRERVVKRAAGQPAAAPEPPGKPAPPAGAAAREPAFALTAALADPSR
jgi:hypothetical protein